MKYFQEDSGLELSLSNFVRYHGLSLHDLYGGRSGNRFFRGLMVEAEILEPFSWDHPEFVKRIPALLNINSRRWLKFLINYLENSTLPQDDEERRMLVMFYYTFYRAEPTKLGFNDIEEGIHTVLACTPFKDEIKDILNYNVEHLDFLDKKHELPFTCPLDIHCSYSMDQVLAAFGYWNEEKAPTFREGVKYFESEKTDIFFITLNKSDKDFSPSTLYEDYAINERLFHWQTQSSVSEETKSAQRYIHHRSTGNLIVLFVREYKEDNRFTSPFVFLGEAEYVSHEGNKPMSIVWRLREEMPPQMVGVANKCIV